MIIEHLISYLYQVKGYIEGGEQTLMTDPINEIIGLLKEGKENDKYKKILTEIEEKLKPGKVIEYDTKISITNLEASELIKMIIKDIKQRYFPEKSKVEKILSDIIADLQQELAKAEYRFKRYKGGYRVRI